MKRKGKWMSYLREQTELKENLIVDKVLSFVVKTFTWHCVVFSQGNVSHHGDSTPWNSTITQGKKSFLAGIQKLWTDKAWNDKEAIVFVELSLLQWQHRIVQGVLESWIAIYWSLTVNSFKTCWELLSNWISIPDILHYSCDQGQLSI